MAEGDAMNEIDRARECERAGDWVIRRAARFSDHLESAKVRKLNPLGAGLAAKAWRKKAQTLAADLTQAVADLRSYCEIEPT